MYNYTMPWKGYRHYNSMVEEFYAKNQKYAVTSINNHHLDIPRLETEDFRVSRFIRDPRDMIVSGYFYHQRGPEAWSRIVDPKSSDWAIVNGIFPDGMKTGQSMADYMSSLAIEDGLIAEIQFRKAHFESMRQWPTDDPRVQLVRYEDMIGNELDTFEKVFDHFEIDALEKRIGMFFADYYSAERQIKRMNKKRIKLNPWAKHIRNPKSGQWRDHFTDKSLGYFNEHYGDLIDLYGYDK